MKPQQVMLELQLLDARKQPVKPEYLKMPYTELEDLVFIRVPDDKLKAMTITGDRSLLQGLEQAAASANLSWVTIGEVTAMLDKLQETLNDKCDKDSVKMVDVAEGLFAIRDSLKLQNKATNKTFILLPETVRFLTVKEKWETIK